MNFLYLNFSFFFSMLKCKIKKEDNCFLEIYPATSGWSGRSIRLQLGPTSVLYYTQLFPPRLHKACYKWFSSLISIDKGLKHCRERRGNEEAGQKQATCCWQDLKENSTLVFKLQTWTPSPRSALLFEPIWLSRVFSSAGIWPLHNWNANEKLVSPAVSASVAEAFSKTSKWNVFPLLKSPPPVLRLWAA